MLTLSIDTATDNCAVALWAGAADGGTLAGARAAAMARGHGEALFGLIGEALGDAGATPRDITRVVALRGPGTFTGLRIGLAAARGLALALDIPALGLASFQLIAAADREATGTSVRRLVAIDARRGEIYVQPIGADFTPACEPSVLAPSDAAAMVTDGAVIVGSGARALGEAVSARGGAADWREIARLPDGLLARLGAAGAPGEHPPTPLYVRPPDAKPQAAALPVTAI